MILVPRIRIFYCLAVFLCFSPRAWAISEENYQNIYDQMVLPFFASQGTEGTIQTSDHVSLGYKYFQHPQSIADIVILQGWTETYPAYAEFVYDMYQQGVSTYFVDWRGQGRSQRFLEDTYKSYVDDYSSYSKDVDAFLEQIVRPLVKNPPIALAFSMGANVLSLYAASHPQAFSRMILVSPMLDIKTDPFPQWFVWLFAKFFVMTGQGGSYSFGHGPFDGETLNMFTSADVRYQQWRKFRKEHPESVVNGATWSWLKASLEATWSMRSQADLLTLPVLMLQAGKDAFVRTEGQDLVCAQAPTCLKVAFPASKHAILAETDRIRNKAFREILEFIRVGY